MIVFEVLQRVMGPCVKILKEISPNMGLKAQEEVKNSKDYFFSFWRTIMIGCLMFASITLLKFSFCLKNAYFK